jgi:valine--pyruvate aminotransferase
VWIEGLHITIQALYQRPKQRVVLVVPGHHYFVGIVDDWGHKHECLRVSYAQNSEAVRRGVTIIAEEVARAYETA